MADKNLKIGIPDSEGQVSLMFARGGARQGAGRRGIGETRKVSLTLPEAVWSELDRIAAAGGYASKSELLRTLILQSLREHRQKEE